MIISFLPLQYTPNTSFKIRSATRQVGRRDLGNVRGLRCTQFEMPCSCCYASCHLKSSTFCVVEAALASGRRDSLWALLLSQFLFKSCKLFHGNFFLLVEYLIDAFDLLDLRSISSQKVV